MTGEELIIWMWLIGIGLVILLIGAMLGIEIEKRYQRRDRRIECCECTWMSDADDIVNCACGLPCCVDCYDDHFQSCPEALEAAGVPTEDEA